MLSFDFLEKDMGSRSLYHILCIIFQEKYFSCYILLTGRISLSDCFYILTYWVKYVLQLTVSQVVMSEILKSTLSF